MVKNTYVPKWVLAVNKGVSVLATLTLVFNMSALGVFVAPRAAQATTWPSSWTIPVCNDDPAGDENPGELDLKATGGSEYGAAYYVDSNYLYVRERIDSNPGTPGNLDQYAWVLMIQKDISTTNYDYLVSLRGSGNGENVELWENTTKDGPIDWSPIFNDPAETLLNTWSTSTNSRVTTVSSDYYIDWRIPVSELTSRGVNLTTSALYFATSANSNNYNKDHLNCYNAPEIHISKQIQKNHAGSWFTDGRTAGITAAPSDTLTYRITAMNAGGPATNVGVTDELGKGDVADGSQNINPATQYSDWMSVLDLNADGIGNSFTGSWGNGSADGQNNDTFLASIANLAGGGASESFSFDGIVKSDIPVGTSLFENYTWLTDDAATYAETDINAIRLGTCDLEVVKSVDLDTAEPGDSLIYTFSYDNVGTADCTGGGVQVVDTVPVETTYVDVAGNHGQPAGVSYAYNGTSKTITWNLGTVNPGESGTLWYTVTVNNKDLLCQEWTIENQAKSWSTQQGWQFTNTVSTDVANECNGTLTVNKYFDDNGDGQADRTNPQGWTWDIANGDQNIPGGTSKSLAQGTYGVSEDPIADYSTSWLCSDQTSGVGTSFNANVVANGNLVCSFTNTRDTGRVTFDKVVVGGNALDSDFSFTVNGNDYHDGDAVTLPTGSYAVTESGPAGYTQTAASGACELSPNGTTLTVTKQGGTCVITNTRDTGTIIVHKNVLNPDDAEVSDNHGFNVTLDNGNPIAVSESANATFANVETGIKSIVESADANYDFVSCTVDGSQEGCDSFTLDKNETVHIYLVNKQKKATVTIYKDVRDFEGNDIADNSAFDITWNGGSGSVSENAPLVVSVNPGSYTFDETANPNYTTVDASQDVTVASNASASLTFVNWQRESSVSGMKFEDMNGNGVKDQGDNGLQNWMICLGQYGDTQASPTCVLTDVNGNYSFGDLLPGSYDIWEVEQNGWLKTTPQTYYNDVAVGVNSQITDKDFGNFNLGKISGYKFNDNDASGTFNQGDTPLNLWNICLTGGNLQQPWCVLTGDGAWADGYYEFTGLTAGDYTVTETLVPGWIAISPIPSHNIYVQSGTDERADFFNFRLGKISGFKYEDKIANGPSNDDIGKSGWTINLWNGNTLVDVTVTNGSGYYEFTNLPFGTYTVTENNQSGWTQTYSPTGDITVTSGADVTGVNFGNYKYGKISGYKYKDKDGDGNLGDSGNTKLNGWTICLNGNTCVVTGNGAWADGYYEFTGLMPGAYTLTEQLPGGWTQTVTPNQVNVQSGTNSQNNNFGNFQNVTVQACKIVDADGNLSTHGDQSQKSGWTMYLWKNGQIVDTQVTSENGCYSWTDLGPGSYKVSEATPAGWIALTSTWEDFGRLDSGASVSKTFKNFEKASIMVTKYMDEDGNVQTTNDRTVKQGWTVELWKDGSQIGPDRLTDANGTYTWNNLGPGTYTVKESFDSNYYQALSSTSYNLTVHSGETSYADFVNWKLPPTKIIATKLVCENESDLPNWGNGGPNITATTATDWVQSHPGCHLEEGWNFQWGTPSAQNPGDTFIGETGNAGWTTFGPTGVDGTTQVTVDTVYSKIWMREGLQEGYLPFSYGPNGNTNVNNVSAELYCASDVVNYDNYDFIENPTMNATYYCVAWNVKNVGDITGTKFNDINGNGVRDDGEQGIEGITINLSNGWTTSTASDGTYQFTDVPVGTYSVSEEVPTGWVATTPNPVTNVLVALDQNATVDFGNFQLGKISGTKYDSHEDELAGWQICITGPVSTCTTTDENGNYEFTDLPFGSYTVSEENRFGWTQLYPENSTYPVDVVSGTNSTGNDFMNQKNEFEVTIDKVADETVKAGDNLTFTLNWEVTGNTPVDAVINDAIPTNTTFVSASDGGTESLGTVTWDLGTQNPYASGSVTLTVHVNSPLNNGTLIENNAQICGTGEIEQNEWFSSLGEDEEWGLPSKCDDDDTTTTVESAPILGINKTNDKEDGTVVPTETINYKIFWSVDGNSQATNVTLVDAIPAEITVDTASISDGGVYDNATRTITWDLGTQVPHAEGFVTYGATVNTPATDGTVIHNVAKLSSDETDPEFYEDDSDTTIVSDPVLGIEKTVSTNTELSFVNPGDTITYTVVVSNTGTDTAYNVTVNDTLPTGFLFADTLTPTHVFTLGDIAVGGSKTITYDVIVGSTVAAGTYDNLAVAQADNHGPVDDSASIEVRVPKRHSDSTEPKISMTKTVNASFTNPGETIEYTVTITLENTGDGSALDVLLTDTLPAGFTFEDGKGEKSWMLNSIPNGTSQVVTYKVKVASNVAGGTYENLAVAKTDTQRVEAKAPILVRIPRVLGETIPETGAGTSDYLLFISSLLMIVAGTLFITEGRRVSRNEK